MMISCLLRQKQQIKVCLFLSLICFCVGCSNNTESSTAKRTNQNESFSTNATHENKSDTETTISSEKWTFPTDVTTREDKSNAETTISSEKWTSSTNVTTYEDKSAETTITSEKWALPPYCMVNGTLYRFNGETDVDIDLTSPPTGVIHPLTEDVIPDKNNYANFAFGEGDMNYWLIDDNNLYIQRKNYILHFIPETEFEKNHS